MTIIANAGIIRDYDRTGNYGENSFKPQPAKQNNSYFDGTGGEYFVIWIVNFFVTLFTLGIMAPWAICRNLNWRKSHTVINGKKVGIYRNIW